MVNKLAPKTLYAVVDKHGDIRHTFISESQADSCADEPRHVERYEIQPPLPSKKRTRR